MSEQPKQSRRSKPGQPKNLGIDLLVSLLEKPGQTAKELDTDNNHLFYLASEAHGVVKVVGRRKHVKPDGSFGKGRPQNEWGLTPKGRKRAQRRQTKVGQVATAVKTGETTPVAA